VLCGYDVTIMPSGSVSFVSFTEADVDNGQPKFNLSNGVLRIVGVNALSPGDGAQHLGQLVFDNPGTGEVWVKAASTTSQENKAVGAALGAPEVIDEQVIAAPEPSGFAQMLSGVIALAGLAAWRARCAG
jgi:hypothetical protein